MGKYSDKGSRIIALALKVCESRLREAGDAMTDPGAVRALLKLRLAGLGHEVFGCLFLDKQNRVLADEQLFRGTLTQTAVYPREVIKAALHHNAGGVILYHNHPSGRAEPSAADMMVTDALCAALRMVDVNVLDHLIVGAGEPYSFSENGLL